MAFPNPMFGRPIRAASAVRLYRQATPQLRAGNDTALCHSLLDIHAGAVRTHELPCGIVVLERA